MVGNATRKGVSLGPSDSCYFGLAHDAVAKEVTIVVHIVANHFEDKPALEEFVHTDLLAFIVLARSYLKDIEIFFDFDFHRGNNLAYRYFSYHDINFQAEFF